MLIPVIKTKRFDHLFANSLFSCWKQDLIRRKFPQLCIKQIDSVIASFATTETQTKRYPISLSDFKGKLYYGKDARAFYTDFLEGKLPKVYLDMLDGRPKCFAPNGVGATKAFEAAVSFLGLFEINKD